MKTTNLATLVIAFSIASCAAQAGSLLPGDITSGSSPTYATLDGNLTIEGFSDSASSIPANLTTGGSPASWFGIGASGALQNTNTMTLQLAPNVGLSGFGRIWTRAVVSISGFTADPGFSVVGTDPSLNSSSYANGILSVDLGWDSGTSYNYSLSNLGASAGQTLTISLDSATGPQFSITQLDYAPVPEPSSLTLGALGGLLLFFSGRRKRA